MNYTNCNSCWQRRAEAVQQGLGATDGRRFNFPAAPAPECAVDGPAQGLRTHEVRALLAAGVIRFPDGTPPVPTPVTVAPTRNREVRPGRPVMPTLLRLAKTGRVFSAEDFAGFNRKSVVAVLSHARQRGLIELVRAGMKGQQGAVSLYRGTKGTRP